MIHARKLARDLQLRRQDRQEHVFWTELHEALEEKWMQPKEFSWRDMFEYFVPHGHEIVTSWNPRHGGGGIMLHEAGDAVTTSDFSNITGQIVYSQVLEEFNNPAFLWPRLVNNDQTPFDGEKIPGVTGIGDQAEIIGEADPFPLAGVSEKFVETPVTEKRGTIVPVTKEAMFFDRTGVMMDRIKNTSHWLGQNKEKRILDVVLGVTENIYKRNGSIIATYGDSSGLHDWDNLQASNALVDWTDVELAELLFDDITDPDTGEPVDVIPDTIICPTALKHTSRFVNNATNIRRGPGGSTGDGIVTEGGNPLDNYDIVTGPMIKSRTSSATTWFVGQPKRAFVYKMNWDITSDEQIANSHDEFHRDIVQSFKVSERGVVAVVEPRYMVKCTA